MRVDRRRPPRGEAFFDRFDAADLAMAYRVAGDDAAGARVVPADEADLDTHRDQPPHGS